MTTRTTSIHTLHRLRAIERAAEAGQPSDSKAEDASDLVPSREPDVDLLLEGLRYNLRRAELPADEAGQLRVLRVRLADLRVTRTTQLWNWVTFDLTPNDWTRQQYHQVRAAVRQLEGDVEARIKALRQEANALAKVLRGK